MFRWRVQQAENGWEVLRSLPQDTDLTRGVTADGRMIRLLTAAAQPEQAFEVLASVGRSDLLHPTLTYSTATLTASGKAKFIDMGYSEAVELLAKMFRDQLAQEQMDPEDGLLAEHWESDKGICFSEKTGDGRDFTNCDWTWRDPAVSLLPLMLQTENDYGHYGAELSGFIENISKKAKAVAADGRFYDCEVGEQFRDMLLGDRRFGVSVDPGAVTAEMECVSRDEDGWCEEMAIIFEAYEVIGLTGTGFPAFAEASIKLDPATVTAPTDDDEGEMARRQAEAAAQPPEPLPEPTEEELAAAQAAVVEAELAVLAELSYQTVCDMEEHGLALHSPFTGKHLHTHSSAGDQGGDQTHQHTHEHANDANHTGSSHKSGTGHASRAEPIVASVGTPLAIPTRPPRAWLDLPEPEYGQADWLDGQPASEFLVEQEDGQLAVPFQILDDGRVFGNLARWGQCHVGYPGQCVSPPEEASFEHFNVGEVVCEDGSRVACGPLTVGCDHAAAHLMSRDARDHYANTGLQWASVHVTSGVYGPWAAGVLRAGITEEQLALIRASALSGDWRRIGNSLRLIAALSVNNPGFPIAREAVTASGLSMVASVGGPKSYMTDGVPTSLVAAGIVSRCPECAKRARAGESGGFGDDDRAMLRHLDATVTSVEKRTRHLALIERDRLLEEIGVPPRRDTAE